MVAWSVVTLRRKYTSRCLLNRQQHSHILHLVALLKVAKEIGVPKVFIHFFGDGRDTDPYSGAGHLEHLMNEAKEIGVGDIATIVGRYYIMDRDKRWQRVEVGLKGVVLGEGEETDDPLKTMKERYKQEAKEGQNKQTDEFLTPIIVGGKERRIQGQSKVHSTSTKTTLIPCTSRQ
jgi:2,3-bisphosphoglycerate-independent phosphoglycerate mutase